MQTIVTPSEISSRVWAAGADIKTLCGRAHVARSTWQRWKSGESPSLRTYERLLAAVAEIESEVEQ